MQNTILQYLYDFTIHICELLIPQKMNFDNDFYCYKNILNTKCFNKTFTVYSSLECRRKLYGSYSSHKMVGLWSSKWDFDGSRTVAKKFWDMDVAGWHGGESTRTVPPIGLNGTLIPLHFLHVLFFLLDFPVPWKYSGQEHNNCRLSGIVIAQFLSCFLKNRQHLVCVMLITMRKKWNKNKIFKIKLDLNQFYLVHLTYSNFYYICYSHFKFFR